MTTQKAVSLFLETLKNERHIFKYELLIENVIKLKTSLDNFDNIEIIIILNVNANDMGSTISLNCLNLPNFSDDLKTGYKLCNLLNKNYPIQFHIDDKGNLIAKSVLYFDVYHISSGFSPEIVLISASTLAAMTNAAYPTIKQFL